MLFGATGLVKQLLQLPLQLPLSTAFSFHCFGRKPSMVCLKTVAVFLCLQFPAFIVFITAFVVLWETVHGLPQNYGSFSFSKLQIKKNIRSGQTMDSRNG